MLRVTVRCFVYCWRFFPISGQSFLVMRDVSGKSARYFFFYWIFSSIAQALWREIVIQHIGISFLMPLLLKCLILFVFGSINKLKWIGSESDEFHQNSIKISFNNYFYVMVSIISDISIIFVHHRSKNNQECFIVFFDYFKSLCSFKLTSSDADVEGINDYACRTCYVASFFFFFFWNIAVELLFFWLPTI